MTQLSSATSSDQTPATVPSAMPSGWMQTAVLAIAILFNLCLVAQLLTVGLAVFMDTSWWQIHRWLVRGYGGLAVLLAVSSLVMAYSQRIRTLAQAAVILLALQFATVHIHQPLPLDIFHPLIGFTLFTVSTTLVHRLMPLSQGAEASKALADERIRQSAG